MSIANTAQAEQWNTGDGVAHWIANQARYDLMHAPFTAVILAVAALRAGDQVLDVGCGCGGTTLAAARLVAPSQAAGLDLSGPMLARARADAEAAGLANAVFQQGDAQVHPLEPDRFGTVISRFGVMFFADPVAAFANIRSATRPGGRLVFVCWQPQAANQWLLVPGAALAQHVRPPDSAPGDGPGMFAFADPDRLRPILAAAGWRDIEITSERRSILVGGGGSVDDAVEFLRTATMGRTMLAGAGGIVIDCAHASFATTMAVLEASSQPVLISHGQLGYPGSTHPRLMTARHAVGVAEAGGLIGAWPCGITSRSLADFGTKIIRLTEVAGPGHVAIGTDLDGNYRPVLTSYDQLDDLASLLHDRGLPAIPIHQILGSNALDLLNRVL